MWKAQKPAKLPGRSSVQLTLSPCWVACRLWGCCTHTHAHTPIKTQIVNMTEGSKRMRIVLFPVVILSVWRTSHVWECMRTVMLRSHGHMQENMLQLLTSGWKTWASQLNESQSFSTLKGSQPYLNGQLKDFWCFPLFNMECYLAWRQTRDNHDILKLS